jgi:hypothetical protein
VPRWNLPAESQCAECLRLVRTLEAARRADTHALRTRLRSVAASSGRDFVQFGIGWVFSIAAMPEDEMKVLLHSHYPMLAEANRKRAQHEAASGHSLKGWWMLSQYSGRQRTD